MFIKSIKINDFRIYFGEKELNFTKNSMKNVYIISGNNGFGKTTLLNSLVWCLYGKQMADVDNKFRKEIYESGGYKKFAYNNMNKLAKENDKNSYSVAISLSNILIPSLPCKEVKVKRTFNIKREEETVKILIDGMENELTREVGHEIFINDFILPKEIAKFFFFDAEKIVTLAEMKSIEDKRNLSKAYSEVLGIKKYEDLKTNLEDLRIRFRRNSATEKDKDKFKFAQSEILQAENLIKEYESQISILNEEKSGKKLLSDQYQEKLIREGNSITVSELRDLKKMKTKLDHEASTIKSKLKDILELAPFAIAGNHLEKTRKQVLAEIKNETKVVNPEMVKKKAKNICNDFVKGAKKLEINNNEIKNLTTILEEAILKEFDNPIENKETKILLGFTDSEQNEFEAIYSNLKYSFNKIFGHLTKEYKNNRIAFNKIIRKIYDAETKENDLLVQEIRQQKNSLENRIDEIDETIMSLSQDIGGLQKEIAIKNKTIVELAKKIEIEDTDIAKDQTAERIIKQLEEFIFRLRNEKKNAIEQRLKTELNTLMHKKDFIHKVNVEIGNEVIDIHLYDKRNETILKETLSKGEQQLFASALLKSLVDESNIKFPVFIDSPLQKFDKKHSVNIICEFYPKISEQVILLPLLEKELTQIEYNTLIQKVNKSFLIKNISEYNSEFVETEPDKLFAKSEQLYNYVY